MPDLIIVESPNKAKKIREMFNGRYEVKATFGHICDLPDNPQSGIGIDRETLRGEYSLTENKARKVDGKRVIDGLRDFLKKNPGCTVYLASDDDREGESISAFVIRYLKLPANTPRLRFNAITQEAIESSILNPHGMDWNQVSSREARRLIDRIIGYTVSPLLQNKQKNRSVSAGRVQTAVEALIIERERKIRNHKTEAYFTVEMDLGGYAAEWIYQSPAVSTKDPRTNSDFDVDKLLIHCMDRNLADRAASQKALIVDSVDSGTQVRLPPPPLNTFSMIQMANKLFGWDASKTMQIAQSLFEGDGSGHGHITYHRTDSLNLDPAVAQEIQDWLFEQNFPVATAINTWSAKNKQAQEAHEAIRPTYFLTVEAGENAEQRNLYKLIRERAIFSQLAPAIYQVKKISFLDTVSRAHQYKSTAFVMEEPGWKGVKHMQSDMFSSTSEDEDTPEPATYLPDLKPGSLVNVISGKVSNHQTKAPPRYTLNTLTGKLEKLSIGRPATIASILNSFKYKKTIEIRSNKLYATSIAEQCYDLLYPAFSFAHIGYTAELETALDRIGEGRINGMNLIKLVWDKLDQECMKL